MNMTNQHHTRQFYPQGKNPGDLLDKTLDGLQNYLEFIYIYIENISNMTQLIAHNFNLNTPDRFQEPTVTHEFCSYSCRQKIHLLSAEVSVL